MGPFTVEFEKAYSEMVAGACLMTMRDYQVEAFLALLGMKVSKEPGPRDWSPRTDPRYSRKAASQG